MRMIRPVCMHFFFSNCLEFLGSTWFLNDFTKAREWVNSEMVPLLLATRKPDGKLTLLDFLAAAPLALLVYSNSSMVQEAASATRLAPARHRPPHHPADPRPAPNGHQRQVRAARSPPRLLMLRTRVW